MVEVVGDRAQLVRHQQHRRAVLLHEVDERVAEETLRLDVDTGDRLVEHEQIGFRRQRLRDQRALLFAARQFADASLPVLRERDRLERVGDRLSVDRSTAAPPALLRQSARGDHLLDGGGEVGRETESLRDVRDARGVVTVLGGSPNSDARPDAGSSRPNKMRNRVDLPEPFGPASAANSPARTERLTSVSTGSRP